ncbi:MAG TPA: ribonuclease P protein component, partial [Saprospiraceae bacterium]|nr:ribonuclease P protein component [Saprospiraceae bacterium]
LKSRKEIARLFKEGRFIHQYPVGLVFKKQDNSGDRPLKRPFRVAFSVPRKKFKKAVERNLLKRRMLEAFRINQSVMFQNAETKEADLVHLMFIYQSKDVESFQSIERAVVRLLQKFSK